MANLKGDEKERARYLYFTTNASQARIARDLRVSERTISVWATEGNWRDLKKQNYYSPQEEVQQLYEELRAISSHIQKRKPEERFPTREELEARTKIISLITSLRKLEGDQWRNVSADTSLLHLFPQAPDSNLQTGTEG